MLSVPAPWYTVAALLRSAALSPRVFRTDLERTGNLSEAGYYEAEVTHDRTFAGAKIAIAIVIRTRADHLGEIDRYHGDRLQLGRR